jgi:two-component system, LytTR family, response regulator
MKRFTAVIVDDEPLARQGIRLLLEQDAGIDVVAECKDGLEAIEQITSLHPDLVFLDIEMPEMNGFDVVASLPAGPLPVFIFVTAYNQYAIEAFHVHAIDYVLKPVDPQRMQEALRHAKELLSLQRLTGDHERLLTTLKEMQGRQGGIERLVVKSHGRLNVIKTGDLDWIEAADDYVYLHANGQRMLLRRTLSSLEKDLDRQKFIRVHRSAIVNIQRVRGLQPLPHGDATLILNDNTLVDVSRSYRTRVEQALDQ